MFSDEALAGWRQDGYVVARGLFTPAETAALLAHYMTLHERRVAAGEVPAAETCDDILKAWPRIMQMHRFDEVSLRWMIDERLDAAMTELVGASPLAVQTMMYFKPPGARGQALHQDQYYLKAQPGTCLAAWMALERCDAANGCLQVVPGSHDLPVLCVTAADASRSFTEVTVPVPDSMTVVDVDMDPGDVLFFNGQVIHGSLPNTTTDRFRRALIGHYVLAEAEQVARFYHPVLRMDGSLVELGTSEGGGPCGRWVERDGALRVELAAVPES